MSDNKHAPAPLTRDEVRQEIKERVNRIGREFSDAFEFINRYPRTVSIFGSARFVPESTHYEQARTLAQKIVKELGYAVVTGGSFGIMEGANRGAAEAGGESLGLNIRLPKEQLMNDYTTDSMNFSYFFTRKVALSFAAEAYVFFPGGFGTLDEFFEIVTLIQTHKIRRVPVFLVGEDYWSELEKFIRDNLFELHNAISKGDMDLYTVTDDLDRIVSEIRSVPIGSGFVRRRDKRPSVEEHPSS
jgi:uncharacterized protein (TIGR00730 family)